MPGVTSTGLEKRFAFDRVWRFRQRHEFKYADLFARVPMPQKIETIPADVVEARKRRVKFRLAGARIVRAEARQKPILIAMPFAMDSDQITELCRAAIRQKPRPEDFDSA